MIEKRRQVRIVFRVIDNEPGIDWNGAACRLDLDRIRMAAWAAGALVDRHVVALAQEPGGRQPGNSGPDDGNIQPRSAGHVCPCYRSAAPTQATSR